MTSYRFGRLQHGFTMLEIAISISILSLLTFVLAQHYTPFVTYQEKKATDARLIDVANAFTLALKADLIAANASAGQILTFTEGTVNQQLPDTNGWCPTTNQLSAIARFSSTSPALLQRDGGGQPMCIYITPPITRVIEGASITYHSVAVVSMGHDGMINSVTGCTTGLSADGMLNLCGDDRGVLVDGLQLASSGLNDTKVKMSQAVAAYQTYFTARLQSNQARDVSIDYFANNGDPTQRWDTSGTIPITANGGACAAVPMIGGAFNYAAALGLSDADARDGWNNVMTINNCAAPVRSPNLGFIPPYTAAISTTLPGGQILTQTAVGTF